MTARQESVPAVYTIGYEGRSVDVFLNALLRAGIRRLIDVRKHALSRKYGFSKRALSELCAAADVDYVHFPELGVPRELRTDLSSPEAYEKLFKHYDEVILPREDPTVQRASGLMAEMPSALMCYESEPACCHRSRLAARLATLTGLSIDHL